MKKEASKIEKRTKRAIVFAEIFLMLTVSFAIAFMWSENISLVSAATAPADSGGQLTGAVGPSVGTVAIQQYSGSFNPAYKSAMESPTFYPSSTNTPAAISNNIPLDAGEQTIANMPNNAVPGGGGTLEELIKQPTPAIPGDTAATGLAANGGTPVTWQSAHPIKSIFGGGADLTLTGTGGQVAGTLIAGVAWAGVAYLAVTLITSFLPIGDGAKEALQNAALAGGFTYGALHAAGANGLVTSQTGFAHTLTTGAGPLLSAVAIAAVVFVLTYKEEEIKVVRFTCLPYEAPIGGKYCEQCNNNPFQPCSEYRCKALGQACELLNKDKPGQELCAWVSKNDVKSPTIQPWVSALSPTNIGLKYTPNDAIRPPNRGVKIESSAGKDSCLPPFTPLQFGITLDKPAKCKVDFSRTNLTLQAGFDAMQFDFGGDNSFAYNHTQLLRLPSPNSPDVDLLPLLENGKNTNLYVKCMDANGNVNEDDFVFSFCVDDSPDTTPPIIEGTSISTNSFVQFNVDSVPIDLYVNEPAQCKWSRINKDYNDMENNMSCSTKTYQINAQATYTCSSNLTGIKNKEDNNFYFRCLDQPLKASNERNVMTQSYQVTLKGSQPLLIDSLAPNNGTIYGSTDTVPVELQVVTSAGAEEGKAICLFSPTGLKDSYIQMFKTDSPASSQTLDLTAGNYKYYIRCIDAGGNAVDSNLSFSVFVDKQAPVITRVYKEGDLKIVTNEAAECVYSLSSCSYNFDEGIKMQYSNINTKQNEFAPWSTTSTYYVKCRDQYGNEPDPGKCQITVSAIDLERSKSQSQSTESS